MAIGYGQCETARQGARRVVPLRTRRRGADKGYDSVLPRRRLLLPSRRTATAAATLPTRVQAGAEVQEVQVKRQTEAEKRTVAMFNKPMMAEQEDRNALPAPENWRKVVLFHRELMPEGGSYAQGLVTHLARPGSVRARCGRDGRWDERESVTTSVCQACRVMPDEG